MAIGDEQQTEVKWGLYRFKTFHVPKPKPKPKPELEVTSHPGKFDGKRNETSDGLVILPRTPEVVGRHNGK